MARGCTSPAAAPCKERAYMSISTPVLMQPMTDAATKAAMAPI